MLKKLLNLGLFLPNRNIQRKIRYNFCAQNGANTPIQVDYNQIMVKIGKAKEFEDKYKILSMRNTTQIFDLVYKPKIMLSLNDYIKVLEQLTKVCKGQTYQQIYGVEKILSKIEEKLKLCTHHTQDNIDDDSSPYIGCLMKSLNIIEYYKNMELWMKICDQICQERMDFTSSEIRESLLGLFIIRRLSNQEWQQQIVQKSIRLLLCYFEVHLSKNQFKLEDIVTLGYALYQHYGSDYLKNKTYILQTIEMNASTQIKTLQDQLYYTQKTSQHHSRQSKHSYDNQSSSFNNNSTSAQQQSQTHMQSIDNEISIESNNDNKNKTDNDDDDDYEYECNEQKKQNEDICNEEYMRIEDDIKREIIQIGFLFSVCDYKCSYIFNDIAYYFAPTKQNEKEIEQFFQENRYLLSKLFFYLVYNYQKKHIANLSMFISIIQHNILSYNPYLNQTVLKPLKSSGNSTQEINNYENEIESNMSSDYKIVYKKDLHYDDIKKEEEIDRKNNKNSLFRLQDLCILLECAGSVQIENIQEWIEEIDIAFSHLESTQCELMQLIRFWKARVDIQQLTFSETPPHLLAIIQEKSVNSLFTQTDVISFMQFCDEESVTHVFVDLYNYLPYYAANNIYFYNWEDMCFLYYHFIKDRILFQESLVHEINGRLNVLKQYIKLEYFSYNNRKNSKMSNDSNFYKVLSVVDINDFYSQESAY